MHLRTVPCRNNTALAGGAVYMDSVVYVRFGKAVFVDNAAVPSLDPITGFQAHTVDDLNQDAAAAAVALNGQGGAVYIAGKPESKPRFSDCIMFNNSAVDGGALYISASKACDRLQEGCYSARLNGVQMANNRAVGGGGGAVYWEYRNLLNISRCPGADGSGAAAWATVDTEVCMYGMYVRHLPVPQVAFTYVRNSFSLYV